MTLTAGVDVAEAGVAVMVTVHLKPGDRASLRSSLDPAGNHILDVELRWGSAADGEGTAGRECDAEPTTAGELDTVARGVSGVVDQMVHTGREREGGHSGPPQLASEMPQSAAIPPLDAAQIGGGPDSFHSGSGSGCL
jgi:hypothetical protein